MPERRYTKTGEWIELVGRVWRVGLAASAAQELGDVTFVEAASVGRSVAAGEALCSLEAVKAAADFYSPVSGRVAAINDRLAKQPELVSTSPEGEGWILALEAVAEVELNALLKSSEWALWEKGH